MHAFGLPEAPIQYMRHMSLSDKFRLTSKPTDGGLQENGPRVIEDILCQLMVIWEQLPVRPAEIE